MNAAHVSQPKWKWFIILSAVIVLSNFYAHRLLPLSENDRQWAAAGSLVDFVIVLPLLAYLFVFRRKRQVVPVIGVALSGYFAAKAIIPQAHLAGMEWVGWLLLAGEAALFAAEIWIIVRLVKTIRSIRRKVDATEGAVTPALTVWHEAEAAFSENRLAKVIISEWMMWKFAVTSWRQKAPESNRHFTAHRRTSVLAFHIMLIHAIILETVGVHWLIHSWSPVLAWIMAVLNIYAVFFFLGEIQAIRLNRVTVEPDKITIPMGLTKRVVAEKDHILSVRWIEEGEYNPKDQTAFHGVYTDMEKGKPQIVIELDRPATVHYIYGFAKKADTIYLCLDQPSEFLEAAEAEGFKHTSQKGDG